ncbi:MAG: COX15/CtaA family protein [Cytophagaceae bacterium]
MNEINNANQGGNKKIILWLFTGAIMVYSMVIIGGITRLTGSGLSITEWNVISGTLPPLNHDEWVESFEKYKQFPEYQKKNSGMQLGEYKKIFFWEYFHRLIGRTIGIVFIIPFLWFYFTRQLYKSLTRKLLIIFSLGGLQGFMGWYMVKSGLVNLPYVSHYRLSIHFFLALTLIVVILITALSEMGVKRVKSSTDAKLLLYLILLLTIVQTFYGTLTAGLKAGFGYNTFPDMNGEWIPASVVLFKPAWINLFDNGTMVQFLHRWLGITLFFVAGASLYYTYRTKKNTNLITGNLLLFLAITAQALLGIFTLIYKVPISLGVIHQGFAIIVVCTNIYLIYITRYKSIAD